MGTSIEWADETWNPVVGCSVYSPGCKRCYAMRMAARLERMGVAHYVGLTEQTKAGPVWNDTVRDAPEHIFFRPLHWRKPREIFVNSMSDLFHEDIPVKTIDRVFAVCALAYWHLFKVLTKRDKRMMAYCNDPATPRRVWIAAGKISETLHALSAHDAYWGGEQPWPLQNVMAGVSVEDAERATRIDSLRNCCARVRFVSAEPLLGPLPNLNLRGIDQVIVGGETGPGLRFMEHAWARDILAQCRASGTAFFMKQMAGKLPIPSDLMVRELPVPRSAEAAA